MLGFLLPPVAGFVMDLTSAYSPESWVGTTFVGAILGLIVGPVVMLLALVVLYVHSSVRARRA